MLHPRPTFTIDFGSFHLVENKLCQCWEWKTIWYWKKYYKNLKKSVTVLSIKCEQNGHTKITGTMGYTKIVQQICAEVPKCRNDRSTIQCL